MYDMVVYTGGPPGEDVSMSLGASVPSCRIIKLDADINRINCFRWVQTFVIAARNGISCVELVQDLVHLYTL